jgi:hypothetical protein
LSAPPFESGSIDCTEALPKVRSPTSLARPFSCSAAAKISAALALPPLTSTTSGRSGCVASPLTLYE